MTLPQLHLSSWLQTSLPVSALSSLSETDHMLQTARSNEGTGNTEDHDLLAFGHVVPNDQEHLVDAHLMQLHETLQNPFFDITMRSTAGEQSTALINWTVAD